MARTLPVLANHIVLWLAAIAACASPIHPGAASPAPTSAASPDLERVSAPSLTGRVTDDNGAPVAGATVVLDDLPRELVVAHATTDRDGQYHIAAPLGAYAMTVAGADSFSWSEHFDASDRSAVVTRTCIPITGHAKGVTGQTRVVFERAGTSDYIFMRPVAGDGSFTACLPEGYYGVLLDGDTLSDQRWLLLTAPTDVQIPGFAATEVRRPPPTMARPRVDLQGLVDDIIAQQPMIVGLGEATHGTSEFYTARAELSFALIRQANVRLLLFEFDAIASADLDSYINGGNIDLAQALPALGFWITDNYEFRHVLEQLRAYNATTSDKIHLRGIDLQNTTLPVNALLARAAPLGITATEQDLLKRLTKRGARVREMSVDERATVDAVLTRLTTPPGHTPQDDRDALAARSLALQLEYWNGDLRTWYRIHRDAGMAELAQLIIAQLGSPRAVLWAHDFHVAKDVPTLGKNLARGPGGYYAVGFYAYQGHARAWDAEGKVGVISHEVPPAPPGSLEGAVTQLTGAPPIAWLPLRRVPSSFAHWLELPRQTYEFGHTYLSIRTFRDIPQSYDAVVVIHTGHPTSPTPTGVRVATP